jgi:serine/threonine protein kinase
VGIPSPKPTPPEPIPSQGEEVTGRLAPGTVVADRYRVAAFLDEGGMGAVYRVEHLHMRKTLAMKVLHGSMLGQPEVVARFEREAVAAGNIDHPNVAAATDFGKLPDGSFFLILEFVGGRSLRSELKAGPMEPSRALRIMRGVVAGVSAAHARGVVHRDLKPENIMLVERDGDPDYVKVLDFGIAKVDPLAVSRDSGASKLTEVGAIIGTPDYMSPEQAVGGVVDARSDLYSLGVIFYELLTGNCPFRGGAVTVLRQRVFDEPTPLPPEVVAKIDPRVADIVRKLLAREPEGRFQTASDLAGALDELVVEREKIPRDTKAPATPSLRRPTRAFSVAAWLPPALVQGITRQPSRVRIGVVALALMVLLGFYLMSSSDRKTHSEPPSAASASGTPIEAPPELPPTESARATPSPVTSLPPPPDPGGEPGGATGTPASKRHDSTGPARSSSGSQAPPQRRTGPGGIYIPPPRDWFK